RQRLVMARNAARDLHELRTALLQRRQAFRYSRVDRRAVRLDRHRRRHRRSSRCGHVLCALREQQSHNRGLATPARPHHPALASSSSTLSRFPCSAAAASASAPELSLACTSERFANRTFSAWPSRILAASISGVDPPAPAGINGMPCSLSFAFTSAPRSTRKP